MRPPCLAIVLTALAAPAMAAETPSPRAVVEAKFAAVNRHATAEIAALYAPDAVVTAPDMCAPRRGRDEVARTYTALFEAVPDAVVDMQEYVVEGDRVAVRFTVRSRLPGRAFEAPIMDFFTVRDGLIVSDDGMFDNRGRACRP